MEADKHLRALIEQNPDTAYKILINVKSKPLLKKIEELAEQFNELCKDTAFNFEIDELTPDCIVLIFSVTSSSIYMSFIDKEIWVRVYTNWGDSKDQLYGLKELKQYVRERILISAQEEFQPRLKLIMKMLKTAWKVWFGWY